MVPLVVIGIFSFTGSFAIGNYITGYILRRSIFMEHLYPVELKEGKKNSLVSFYNRVKVVTIPNTEEYSPTVKSEMWYNKTDYLRFSKEYSIYKKYNSI